MIAKIYYIKHKNGLIEVTNWTGVDAYNNISPDVRGMYVQENSYFFYELGGEIYINARNKGLYLKKGQYYTCRDFAEIISAMKRAGERYMYAKKIARIPTISWYNIVWSPLTQSSDAKEIKNDND